MPTFYKCLVQSSVAGQDINNILYYAPVVPTSLAFDPVVADALGDAVASAWADQIRPLLSNQVAPQLVEVSMVDADGFVVSPYAVTVPMGGTSSIGDPLATAAMVLIWKFNCSAVAEAPGHSVPRRSYLAIGPLTEAQVGTDGLIAIQAGAATALAAATTEGHLISGTQFVPYRIGRTSGPTVSDPSGVAAGVGRVVSGIVRPYASFRRSRLRRPTGA
jgi:hypothetical protein